VDRRRESLPTRVDDLPDLPAAYHDALDAGLATLGAAGGALRRDGAAASARRAIDDHVRLLLAWNRAINLTAITDAERIAVLHVLDSLTAIPLVAARRGRPRLADLGSGGGFPGIPLAAAVPTADVVLVESIGKKARFLEAAVGVAGLDGRVRVMAVRAESLATPVREGDLEPFDVVTARAVGALDELVRLSFPLLVPGGRLVAWKRGDLAAEMRSATRAAAAFGGARITVRPTGVPGLEGHVLVVAETAIERGRTRA
jgi:16S rRNA (guanine527-N7)-methyltransferase